MASALRFSAILQFRIWLQAKRFKHLHIEFRLWNEMKWNKSKSSRFDAKVYVIYGVIVENWLKAVAVHNDLNLKSERK